MAEAAHEIESHGCFLKDIDLGLVDFPWEIDAGRSFFSAGNRASVKSLPGIPSKVASHSVSLSRSPRSNI
jgi:hypothetical protein